METKQLHSVDKIHVRVHTHSEENGYYLKDHVGTWINEHVLPGLESFISSVEEELGPQVIQFDQLKLSLELKDGKLQTEGVFQQVIDQMEAQIRPLMLRLRNAEVNGSSEIKGTVVDVKGRETETFFHFLKTGRSPWWASSEKMNELLAETYLEQLIESQERSFYVTFLNLLESPVLVSRLVRQFSSKFLYKITLNSFSAVRNTPLQGKSKFSKEFYQLLDELSHNQKEKFWSAIIKLLLLASKSGKSIPFKYGEDIFQPLLGLMLKAAKVPAIKEQQKIISQVEELTQTIIPQEVRNKAFLDLIEKYSKAPGSATDSKSKNSTIESAQKTGLEEEELEKSGIIVESAGLILIHPFLKHFLVKTGLMNESNEFSDPELAVHVIHYIATGKQQDWDHNLLFEKFLCNISLHQSITRDRTISPEIIEEVESLLDAVRENWSALRTSSNDLLRNEFLQRPGKLFVDDISARLTVERKTYDILLDKLPWNISMVKLPWHRQLTYITW